VEEINDQESPILDEHSTITQIVIISRFEEKRGDGQFDRSGNIRKTDSISRMRKNEWESFNYSAEITHRLTEFGNPIADHRDDGNGRIRVINAAFAPAPIRSFW
jgi:hypothetical protein